jgi:hypothetical protein
LNALRNIDAVFTVSIRALNVDGTSLMVLFQKNGTSHYRAVVQDRIYAAEPDTDLEPRYIKIE